MIPKFLRPEVLSYASVEIVRAEFHTFLTAPATSAKLDAMLADNAKVDADLVLCPWCPAFTPTDPRHAGLSHAMCTACVARFEEDDRDDRDEDRGSTCGAACGFCGACS